MTLCIYGAGAVGGHLGVELALAGFDVTLIARGPHLEAIRPRPAPRIRSFSPLRLTPFLPW